MIKQIQITKDAQKDLKKAPNQIKRKFFVWVAAVEEQGVEQVRKTSGFHDEPLHGKRKGQRSIRLNDQWRAFYIINNGTIEFIEVIEVNPHDYKK